MRPSTKAWVGLGLGVVTYDVMCPPGETLSEGLDRLMEHPIYKFMCIGMVGTTALHLCNVLPPSLDPFTQSLRLIKGDAV